MSNMVKCSKMKGSIAALTMSIYTTDGCLASFQMLIGVIDNGQLIGGW